MYMEVKYLNNLNEIESLLKGVEIPNKASGPFYYIKEPKEGLFVESDKLIPIKGPEELKKYIYFEDIKLLEAINSRFIPIYEVYVDSDGEKKTKLIFSEEDYTEYRKKISGIDCYGTGDYILSDDLYFPELQPYLDQIDRNIREIEKNRKEIDAQVIKKIGDKGFSVGIGGDSGCDLELIETGSTSRYTNTPSREGEKPDFDFVVRCNPEDTWATKDILYNDLDAGGHIDKTSTYRVRLTDVPISGLDSKVDLDFSLIPQKKQYLSSDEAISVRLEKIRSVSEEKYRLVLANIMFAKDLLKKADVYKPSRSRQDGKRSSGGLGGIGIENWILQNGGSFIDAAVDFLSHSGGKDFIDFEKEFSIMNPGFNHVAVSKGVWPHDNFVVNNMRQDGYLKMRDTLIATLKEVSRRMKEQESMDIMLEDDEELKDSLSSVKTI